MTTLGPANTDHAVNPSSVNPTGPGSPSAPLIQRSVATGDAALIAYLPLGFPTVDQSVRAALTLLDNGVDIIELGFPYSDPGMDGPVIQRAAATALTHGTHLEDLFEAVETLSATGAPILSMTYWNPVNWYGVERFAEAFAQAGGAGLITPDLPPEEAGEWVEASDKYGLERVFLTAPSSTEHRLKLISNASSGWVYAAATMGVTGARSTIDARTHQLVERTREAGAQTVCVGLGVSTGEQARTIGSYADGVIVGSAFVRPLLDEDFPQALSTLSALAQDLRRGVQGSRKGSE